ncbi:MAG: hypothetical protein E6G60_00100 [Actinobacteria bacterium]|nr:MAG: hypothetical protein E6G60_00100 [Actinomycetota bacterium]
MNQRRIAAIVVGVLLATGLVGLSPAAGANAAAPARYAPKIDPRDFGGAVDNPWFPLVPGTRWTYAVKTAHGTEANTVEVTHETREILGVTSVVVHDVVRVGDRVTEETFDWYAQDRRGNVWYFGEDTKEFAKNGKVSTEGSWESGVDNAYPGIIMKAKPRPGVTYREEYYRGHAEDTARVLGVHAAVKVRAGSYRDAVKTQELTRLEPKIVEHKYYARGVGIVLEVLVKGGVERAELTDYSTP